MTTNPSTSPDPDRVRPRLWATFGCAASAAAAFGVAFPPIDFWPAILLVPALLGIAAIGASTWFRAVLAIYPTQVALWLLLHVWMFQVTLPGTPALALYLAVWPTLFALSVRGVARSRSPLVRRVPIWIAVPILWTAWEFFRGQVAFDGYPWFYLAHPLINWLPFVQSADLLGTLFVSFLAATAAGVLLAWWVKRRRREPARTLAPVAIGVGALLLLNVIYGFWRLGQTSPLVPGPTILAIQTDLPQSNKIAWTFEDQVNDVRDFIALTRRAVDATDGAIDAIALPETMIPGFGFDVETLRTLNVHGSPYATLAAWIIELQRDLGIPMIVGSPARLGLHLEETPDGPIWDWEDDYNAAYLIAGTLPYQRYDKLFLTPFGETMPYISEWEWLERQMLAFGAPGMSFDLEPGPVLRRLALPVGEGETVLLGTPICFEDTVPSVCRELVWNQGEKAAKVLLNLSNDGWFGPFDAGRERHVQIARFRAIENRVPLVRAANTGRSVHVDSRGAIVPPPPGQDPPETRAPGWLQARTQLDRRRPLFGLVGDGFAWTCLAAGGAIVLLTLLSRPRT